MTWFKKWTGIAMILFCILTVAFFVSCGGGGKTSPQTIDDDDSGADDQISSDATGIWNGTFEETNDEIFSGIAILYASEIRLISEDAEAIYLGTYSVNGASFSATLDGYEMGGSHFTTTQINGTFAEDYIDGTFTTSDDTSGTFSFSFDTIYNRDTSFELLAGEWSYSDSDYTFDISIDSFGAVSGSNSNGCIMTGAFSLIDPSRNLYALDADVSQCEDVDGQYDGYAITIDESMENDTLLFIITNDQRIISYKLTRH